MKKYLVLLVLLASCFVGKAYDFSAVAPTGQTLYYNITSFSSRIVEVTSPVGFSWNGFSKPTGTLTIPTSVSHGGNTYSVTSIGNGAFSNCFSLTSVSIPNSVISIGEYAFDGCGLRSISIPNSVTLIGDGAFSSCNSLTSVSIPNSVTSIGATAFYNCFRLMSLTIPNSVTSIGNSAFYRIRNIVYSGNAIGSPWGALTVNGYIEDNLVYEDSSKNTLTGCYTMTSNVTIPNSVTSIGNSAFYGCSLMSVTIPDSVISIGNSAFSNCSNLTNVTIGNSVTSIGGYAFSGCNLLTSVSIPNSVTSIGNNAFYNCNNLSNVTIGYSVTSIGSSAFSGCNNLTSISIPNSVTSIGSRAFYYCNSLTSVTISNSVISIEESTFAGCSSLYTIFSNNPTAPSLGANCFYNCPIQEIHIPCGSSDSYSLRWSLYGDYLQEPDAPSFQRVLQSADTTIGEVSLLTLFCADTSTISAIPNYGYHFTKWSDNNTDNPRTFVLTQDTTFTALFAISQYAIVGTSASDVMGTVIGSDTVDYLQFVTLTATANYGYHFTQWSDGNTQNPRTIVADSNKTYTAQFDYNNYTLSVSSDNPAMGTVVGSGSFNYLSTQNISATANYGYHFTQWNDGNTNNPRSIVLTHDTTFIAEFGHNQYTVTSASADTIMGSTFGDSIVDYLQQVTLTALPNYGYHFIQWNDGNTQNPRTIVADSNKTYIAQFGYNTYMVAKSCDTLQGNVMGVDSADYLSNVTLTAIPSYGYHFTQWSDSVTSNPRTFVLTQDTTFTAEFERNSYTITCVTNDVSLGQVQGSGTYLYLDTIELTATAVDHYHFTHWQDGNTENPRSIVVYSDSIFTAQFAIDTQHIVVMSSDINMGYVSGGGDIIYGQPVTVEAIAYSGYHFSCWSNGCRYNPYTFAAIQDLTLEAIFISDEAPYYTITVAANNAAMGSVTGSGTYDDGTVAVITATPHEGCIFLHWNDGDTATERMITVNATATYTAYFVPESCNVTTSINDANAGTVSGDGIYRMGDTITLTATANEGYLFTQWSDGNTETLRTIVVDENLSEAMQPLDGTAYGITFTAYFEPLQGIDDLEISNLSIRAQQGHIVIEGAQNEMVRVFDITGRNIVASKATTEHYNVSIQQTGVYFVKVGDRKAEKVVVLR